MNKRTFQAEVKALGDGDTGDFEVILSTSSIDRDGERIAPYALQPLPDHITFDIDHEMRVMGTVGSGKPEYIQDGMALRVRGNFASTPLAQTVRTLVREEHIRTTSVALRVKDAGPDEEDGVWTVRNGELLNGAFVAIPANPEAIVLAAKSLSDAETKTSADEADEPEVTPVADEAVSKDTAADSAEPAADEAADSAEPAAVNTDESPVDPKDVVARAAAVQRNADRVANDE